jgi:hypothetical protein
VTASLTGVLLGLLVGLRHAFEPDHLTAVSTLVSEARDGRRGALLGALWGLGHTLALLIVGLALLIVGETLPARVAASFELVVSIMLIVLGARAIALSLRPPRADVEMRHRHGSFEHTHHEGVPHIHVAGRVVAWRPLVVGLIHGLAGSGALTALVFAELPTFALRAAYIALFGIGSIVGMALASGAAGASLRAARGPRMRRTLSLLAGAASIVLGFLWGVPLAEVLLR